ncbi:MAG: hypothetical protein MR409_09950, partial [Lachnospiraceae bacterium]|nr:hypothetical protein [Lachnospiraceae bacterium]
MTLVQNGVASILFTSEISSTKIESLLIATVTESSNAELKNTKAERRISLNPNIEGQKDQTVGASLTDVMVETCDRVVLFFNKDVDVANYTKNTDAEKYAYDSNRMEIKILDNAKTKESIADTDNTISPKALYPVKDNPKALYAILDTDSRDDAKYLTDNAKAIVKVTDKTKTIPVTETKSTIVTDIHAPSILDVKQNGLRSIDVIFSEPVQNGKYSNDGHYRDNSAEVVYDKDTDKWVIDTRTLSDESWGSLSKATAEVGKFNVTTGEDRRNVVTITLGTKANGDQIYFKAGKHSVQGNKIGDWANVTDEKNNFINTQTLDFTIEADETAPKMDVKVESPEQYYVTFNTDVDANKVKDNLKLQQYKDNTWKNIDKINIRQVDNKEFIVELTKDWTDKDILDTYTSKKNYYNYNFRLHMDEKVHTNLSNGLKNAEINCNLDNAIMKNPDVTSPKLKDVTQNGQESVIIEFNEPAQINGFTDKEHQITPTVEQKKADGGDLSLPIIQFISEDNSKTIKGKVDSVNENDTKIYVKPEDTLTEGTWKVVVRNVSDDIGNTAETLVKNDFVVKGGIPADTGFRVRWIVAVPKDTFDPIAGGPAPSDVIYVKFNKQIKTYGNAANAGATTNYTVNDYTLPSSKIDAFIDDYNKAASNYGYSDIVAIHLKDTALTASSNTININKTLESAAGAKLDNGGKFLLSKVNGRTFFTWNYKDYSDSKGITVSDVQKLLDNEEYDTLKFSNGTISDLNSDKTTFKLTHSGTVDFDGQKVHELTINTMETGILEVKNIKADKVTVYAPYAEVKINNTGINTAVTDPANNPANIGELDVEDVLNGTLTLSNSIVGTLTVTDSNEGKIRLEGANTAINKEFVIDTTGEITLEVGKDSNSSQFDIANLPTTKGVEITKACTLHVKDDGANIDSNTIKITVASEEVAKKVTITEDTKDLVKCDGVTVKAEGAKAVEISDVTSKNGEDAAVITPATPAKTEYTISGEKVATGGWITVNVANTKPVSIEVSKDDTPAKLAAAISKETFKGYTVKVDNETKSKSKLIFTSVKTGTEAAKFDVTIDFGSVEGLNEGTSTKVAGEDAKKEETAGSSSFTVESTGKNVAGTIKITVDGKEATATVGAFDDAQKIATAIESAIKSAVDVSTYGEIKAEKDS